MRTSLLGRRRVLQFTIAAALAAAPARAAAPIKAVAFDAFVIFDPQPIVLLAEAAFPGHGQAFNKLWRIRQFEYTWLRTLTGSYVDFWRVTEEALVYAARALKLDLTPGRRDQLMQGFLALQAHPDASPGLDALRAAGIRLAFLSNMTEPMLQSAIRNAGFDGLFDHVLSTDRVGAYKPDPRAYRMGLDAFGRKREEIVFAAFGGWDAAGGANTSPRSRMRKAPRTLAFKGRGYRIPGTLMGLPLSKDVR